MNSYVSLSTKDYPDDEINTGSNLQNFGLNLRSNFAMACAIARLGTMPIFTHWGIQSSMVTAAWSKTNSASMGILRCTPNVFCTVKHVGTACA